MVRKIFLILFSILLIGGLFLTKNGNVETNLLKTILPPNIAQEIIPIADKSASVIKVVFETDENLEGIKNEFENKLDKNYFEIYKPNNSELLNKYLSNPTNFLSDNTRKLIQLKKYNEVYEEGLKRLYSPVQISQIDKDPYLVLDDFLNSLGNNSEIYFDGKYYDFLQVKFINFDSLSPNLSNEKIAEIIKLQKELSQNNSKIYLGGNPIHSYYTSQKSMLTINIICVISLILIIFLTYYYFRNIKNLLPIILSIIFGILSGYIATKLWFKDFQILTLVFSTTIIGIGIDYSYHYIFAEEINKNFIKNLSISLITTLVPFALFYITGIELLKQISIFMLFGLSAIYIFVLLFYPCFNLSRPVKTLEFNYQTLILIPLCLLAAIGFTRFKFNDTLTSMYSPPKHLQYAESLYEKSSDQNYKKMLIIKGDNLEDILEKEEKVTQNLSNYICLSKFVPSKSKQKENFDLIKDLYKNNLYNYSNILTQNQIENLKNLNFEPVDFKLTTFLNNFILNPNTSIIFTSDNIQAIDIQSDISKYLKSYRKILLNIFPLVLIIIFLILLTQFGIKKGLKILTPSIIGIFVSIGIVSLIYGEINLFSIISIYLVLGFTMDYAIFRNSPQNEDAILVSCLTTSLSFLLLALSNFKLLSTMSLILFFGIVSAYLSGYIVKKQQL